jgi:Tol biopolymer transport system component
MQSIRHKRGRAIRRNRYAPVFVFLAIAVAVVMMMMPRGSAGASHARGSLVWVTYAGSPDGYTLATARGDGSGDRELLWSWEPFTAALSPDASRVAMVLLGAVGTGPPRPPAAKAVVAIRSASHGSQVRLIAKVEPSNPPGPITWSPDGKRLAFATNRGIWTVGADGSRLRLTVRKPRIYSIYWSPDGAQLVFTTGTQTLGQSRVWIAGSDGRSPRRLTDISWQDGGLSWSDDGRLILFSSKAGPRMLNGTMYALDVNTGARRTLGSGNAPSYSPDGTPIAFLVAHDGSPFVRLGISTSAGRERRLYRAGWEGSIGPVWSPDGTEVVGHAQWSLVAVRIPGGDRHTLAATSARIKDLGWAE